MATRVKKVPLAKLSMFSRTPAYDVNGTIVFGLQRPVILKDSTDQIYTVPQGMENRLDKISFKFLGTSQFWWAIAQLNDLVDPFLDIPVGTQLRIPKRNRLPVS